MISKSSKTADVVTGVTSETTVVNLTESTGPWEGEKSNGCKRDDVDSAVGIKVFWSNPTSLPLRKKVALIVQATGS